MKAKDGGYFVIGATNSNDGDVNGNHGGYDGWVVKISSAGAIKWKKCLGGSGDDVLSSAVVLGDGSLICAGSSHSNDGDVSGNHGGSDNWVVKLSRNGEIIWSKCFGTNEDEFATQVIQIAGGNFVLSSGGTWNRYRLLEIDGLGNELGKVYDSTPGGYGHFTYIDGWPIAFESKTNKILVGASKLGRIDPIFIDKPFSWFFSLDTSLLRGDHTFDFSNSMPYPVVQSGDLGIISDIECSPSFNYVTKEVYEFCVYYEPYGYMDARRVGVGCGNLFLAEKITNPIDPPYMCQDYTRMYGERFKADYNEKTGSLVMVGSSTNTEDPGYKGNEDAVFVYGLSQKQCYGGSGDDFFSSIQLACNGNYILCGNTKSNDGDVSGNHGNADIWIIEIGWIRETANGNGIMGTAFIDLNGNGIKDNIEPPYSGGFVKTEKQSSSSCVEIQNGSFSNMVDTGTYLSSLVSEKPYYSISPTTKQSIFASYGNVDSFGFGLVPIAGKKDYSVNLFSTSASARPGFNTIYRIVCKNTGTDTLMNKPVTLIKDGRTDFLWAQPMQQSLSGDTIGFLIPVLLPGDTAVFDVGVALQSQLQAGDTLFISAAVDSMDDVMTGDNYEALRQLVGVADAPILKRVNFADFISKEEVETGKELLYTIHFQNTGNDTVFYLTVRDTLDASLDWSSLEMVGASHPYKLTVLNGRYCSWQFSEIGLVGSSGNDSLSRGFISYRIKARSTLALGEKIINRAFIYFDCDYSIGTSLLQTEVKLAFPPKPKVTGLMNLYCKNQGQQECILANMPSAQSQITVVVKLDTAELTVSQDSVFRFDIGQLSAGDHHISVIYSNATGESGTEWHFTVVDAATPVVSITSNIIDVTNLIDPVIFTATNTSGGGAVALYTFAKDNQFKDVLQGEGTSNVLAIQPAILAIGQNWIFVRMKTSEACNTRESGTDSIMVNRSPATGLIDPDYPWRVIKIYPNPFEQTINISGLSTGKLYSVIVTSETGQRLHTYRIFNSANATIFCSRYSSGIYWFSLYDETNKRLIGTTALLRM